MCVGVCGCIALTQFWEKTRMEGRKKKQERGKKANGYKGFGETPRGAGGGRGETRRLMRVAAVVLVAPQGAGPR